MKLISVFVSVLPAALGICLAQAPNSTWVYPSGTANLLYQLDQRGQRITDFSQCGYRGGTEPLPNVSVLIPQDRWVYLSPGAGDDTALIQAAIDSVEAMTPDANGWRGVVYLNAGEYQLAETITIAAGGVVLKGAGDDPATGTRLRATDANQYDLISVSGSGSRSMVANTTRNLTQKLVPAGARTFEVDSTSGLAVGHTVIVKRPSTAGWIADIDMDQLGPGSGGDPEDVPWTEGTKDLLFDRTITHIEGNRITVDAPLPQTFESQYGGGQIWRYTWSGRIQQVGIEDIYAFSDYASATDENHAWTFIDMNKIQHGWVRNITAQYFGLSAVWLGTDGKWITVADSQCLDPISLIEGGRRYPFQNTDSELTLFVNNHARNGRHDFSFGALVPGPNAFVHGTADSAKSDSGPHQRWAVGGLFDLITINGNEINVQNRGNSGSGHGWAGAYMAVWNSQANGFRVRNPPTACNWLVGSVGSIGASQNPVGADPPGTYDSSGSTGKAVYPRSLYYGQLQQRMKWPDSEFREVWLGDVDQHNNNGASDTVNCDAAWLAQVEAMGAPPADADFDSLVGNRHTACTLDFSLDPGDTIVAASLTVSLRGIGSADSDKIRLDSTANYQTYASLGWTPISTTGPTVCTMEVSPALLADGRLNLAVGANSAVDFVVLHLQVQKAQPPTRTITLSPVADAYVRGSNTYAATNYGNDPSLQTKDITVSSVNRETFLRWDLSGISGKILQARVRLAGTTSSQPGNESCATFVSDDTWGETTLTFNNKPSAGKLFAQWLPVAGQPVEFIVTPQVLDTQLGDQKLSLRLASTGNYGAPGNVTYASRENPTVANRPQLILTLEDTAPTITSVPDQTVNENTATPALPVVLGDDYTAVASLTLTGTSSNPTLVPDANIVFGGSGANRSVTVTPASNQNGSATITLTVSDGTLNTSTPFLLTVISAGSTAMIKAATGDTLHLGAAWVGGIVPVNPDTATWNTTSLTGTMTLGADQSWGGIIITDPAAPLTFNGTQTLTLSSAGIDLSTATVDLTLNHPVILGQNQQWNVGAGRTLAASGIISGLGSLMKTGTGNLILSAANTYNGGTIVSAGMMSLGASNVLASAPVSLGAATLSVGGGFSDTVGTLDVTGAATIALGSGTSALTFADSSAVDWTGGTLNLTGTFVSGASIKFGAGGLTSEQLAKISAPGWISFALNGGGFLTAIMIRTWDGSDSNSWEDILNWSGDAMPGSGDYAAFSSTSTSGYNIHLGSADRTINKIIFDSSTGTNPYAIHLSDGVADPVTTARTLTITGSGCGITVDAGTHTLKGRKPGSGTLGDFIMGNGIAFNIASGTSLTLDTRLRSSSSTNNFSKTGAGALVLNADNGGGSSWGFGSATTGFTVSAGVLRLATVNTLGNSGNKFVVSSGAAMEITGGVSQTVNNGTITLNGSGVAGNGALRSVSGSNAITGTGTGGIVLASDSSIGVDAGTLTISQVISGAFSLSKVGAGTLTLTKANTYGGGTIVNDGTLALSGSLAGPLTVNAGTFAPQGLPVASGAVSLNEGGILLARINGPTAGTQYDQLAAGDSVTLGGALDLAAGPGLTVGATFSILNKTSAGAISETFADRPEGGVFIEDGYNWLITYLGGDGNDIVLTLVPAPPTTYASWISGFFPGESNPAIIGADADPDSDAIPNAVEMVLGGNPKLVMDAALLPTLALVTDPPGIPAGNYLLFTYRRSDLSASASVTAECETNTGLATPWTPAAAIPGAIIQVDDNFTFAPPAAADTDRVRVYVPRGEDAMRFGRLRVIIP